MLEELLLDQAEPEILYEIARKYLKLATIVMVCDCEVIYEGRASSRASKARRLIIIKEDGTLMIHEGLGVKPINWQPNSSISIRLGNNEVELVATRSRPKEVVKVMIKGRLSILICKLGTGKFSMSGTEEEMINYISLNPSLIEEGAQLVAKEVITPHGRIDIILRGVNGDLIIVECKRGLADLDAVHQLRRYVEYYRGLGINVRGILASPTISPQALKFLVKYGLNYAEIKFQNQSSN